MIPRWAALPLIVVVLAACGQSGTDSVTIGTAEAEPGTILVDPDGHSLYLFLPDQQREATCTGACAQAWPPLTAPNEVAAGPGVDADLLGTIERPDGALQVTYNGWPLYRYSGDLAPGDTNGHGLLNVWFAVTPVGGAAGLTK